MAKSKIRVRYAPSPTGHLHIGNARTALFNYLFARHNKGTFVIRIEDTDTKRNIADGEKSQLDNLKWLGLDWDEGPDKPGEYGPYRQSERQAIYTPLIEDLVERGLAYKSYKTEDELTAERDAQKARNEAPHYVYEYEGMDEAQIKTVQAEAEAKGLEPVVRIRLPKQHTYEFDDIVKGKITFESDRLGGDFVIMKRDGMPTYNFAVVVDDHMMEITHVLRGDDHIANTPKQLAVYDAFGWEPPIFGHMTLIINTETGKKLSKRDESVLQFIEQYRELGYLPEAMLNFITLLGWSPVGEKEIFTRQEFIKQFDPKRLSRSPASFDQKKLEWVNNQYVKAADGSRLMDLSLENLIQAGKIAAKPDGKTIEWVRQLVSLYQGQMSYTAQIVEMADVFFSEPEQLDADSMKELEQETAPVVLREFSERLNHLDRFTAPQIMAIIKSIQKDTKIKGRQLYMPIRIATTREMHGPSLPEAIELLGRDKVQQHLQKTLAELA